MAEIPYYTPDGEIMTAALFAEMTAEIALSRQLVTLLNNRGELSTFHQALADHLTDILAGYLAHQAASEDTRGV